MVKLDRIYTRGGDGGMTSLVGGARVSKHSARLEAMGAIDEANAAIGIARLTVAGEADAMLRRIQNEMFDLGADIATPETGRAALRIAAAQTQRLEQEIDALNAALAPLTSFILPGGTPAAAHLHLARTIVRRAERACVRLAAQEPVHEEALRYLNRLSDHLFVLARRVNDGGDTLWQPGETR